MKNSFYKIAVLFTISCFLWQCANVGVPTGGDKDETPPVLVKSTPEPKALNYDKDKVVLEFDELIQLKDIFQNFVASPPFNDQPVVEARGEKVLITFKEDLQPNTTYSLNFANSIVDNNEGNILEDFSFSFSTGLEVDSLKISGHIWDAADLAPSAGALVLLHENLNDSAIQTLVPVRLAKTDQFGHFTILNVRPGQYRIFALEDANRDYKFDQPGEFMAWSDLTIEPNYEYREATDSIAPDSVVFREEIHYLPDSLELFIFQHNYKKQYILTEERKEQAKLHFIFNKGMEKAPEISRTNHDNEKDLFLIESSLANDTVTYWLKDSAIYHHDSLSITLKYPMLDSLDNEYLKSDTIAMYFFKQEVSEKKNKKKRKKEITKKIPSIKIKGLTDALDKFNQYNFSLPAPAIQFDQEAVHLYVFQDTIPVEIDFKFTQNPNYIRNYSISHKWEHGAKYQLHIDSAAITDIYGLTNNTIEKTFIVKELDKYGIVYASIINPQDNWLLQVINRNDVIIQQAYVPKNGKLGFRYLNPGKYMFRIIADTNMNESWDSGNYYESNQPEKVYYYMENIDVRANWEYELETWDPTKFNIDKFSRKYRKAKSKN